MISKKYVKMFGEIAEKWSSMSYCTRAKVGALIIRNNQIIASAYNGTPSGSENVCEIDNKTTDLVIHAEMNALLQVAKSTDTVEGSVMVCTHAPCVNCAKHIIQSGITKVYYNKEYRDRTGLEMLIKHNIETEVIEL